MPKLSYFAKKEVEAKLNEIILYCQKSNRELESEDLASIQGNMHMIMSTAEEVRKIAQKNCDLI